MTPVEVSRGDGPVVLGLPHTGTWLPEEVRQAKDDGAVAPAHLDWGHGRSSGNAAPEAAAALVRDGALLAEVRP